MILYRLIFAKPTLNFGNKVSAQVHVSTSCSCAFRQKCFCATSLRFKVSPAESVTLFGGCLSSVVVEAAITGAANLISCARLLPHMEAIIYATRWVIRTAKAGTARSLLDSGHDVDAEVSGQHANAAAGMSTSQMPMLGLSSQSAVFPSLQREHPMHPPLVAANLAS